MEAVRFRLRLRKVMNFRRLVGALESPVRYEINTSRVVDSPAVHVNFALPCSQLRAIIAALRNKKNYVISHTSRFRVLLLQ